MLKAHLASQFRHEVVWLHRLQAAAAALLRSAAVEAAAVEAADASIATLHATSPAKTRPHATMKFSQIS